MSTKKPAKKAPGRPTVYSDTLAAEICRRLTEGESLRNICLSDGVPCRNTVIRWLADERYATFRDQYARAREAQADFYADQILDIADETTVEARHDGEDVTLDLSATAVARNRLRVDARKWYASKLAPKKYGDRVDLSHSGTIGLISQILSEIDGKDVGLPSASGCEG